LTFLALLLPKKQRNWEENFTPHFIVYQIFETKSPKISKQARIWLYAQALTQLNISLSAFTPLSLSFTDNNIISDQTYQKKYHQNLRNCSNTKDEEKFEFQREREKREREVERERGETP
jgi:hypothetical protein